MAESLISVEELNGDFESLLKVVNDKKLLEISPEEIAQLTVPRVHVQKNNVQLTFEDQWNRRMTRFSDENIKKIDTLWNTKCRDLLLQHVKSLHGHTLAEELLIFKPGLTADERRRKNNYEYQKDPKRYAADRTARRRIQVEHNLARTRTEYQVIGLNLVSNNEEGAETPKQQLNAPLNAPLNASSNASLNAGSESGSGLSESSILEESVPEKVPNCKGHVYDQFGFLKYHNKMLCCGKTTIWRSFKARESILKRGTIDAMLEELNSTQAKEAVDGEFLRSNHAVLRREAVSKAKTIPEIVHIPLGDRFQEWSSLENLRENVTKLISENKLLPGYKFYVRHCVPSTEANPYVTVSLQCANARRHKVLQYLAMPRAIKSTAAINCRGQLQARVYLESKTLVIRHVHRHHYNTSKESGPVDHDTSSEPPVDYDTSKEPGPVDYDTSSESSVDYDTSSESSADYDTSSESPVNHDTSSESVPVDHYP